MTIQYLLLAAVVLFFGGLFASAFGGLSKSLVKLAIGAVVLLTLVKVLVG